MCKNWCSECTKSFAGTGIEHLPTVALELCHAFPNTGSSKIIQRDDWDSGEV